MRKIGRCFGLGAILVLIWAVASGGQQTLQKSAELPEPPREGDFVVRDFHFQSGETLAEVRLHYTTLGTAVKDAAGADYQCGADSAWHWRGWTRISAAYICWGAFWVGAAFGRYEIFYYFAG